MQEIVSLLRDDQWTFSSPHSQGDAPSSSLHITTIRLENPVPQTNQARDFRALLCESPLIDIFHCPCYMRNSDRFDMPRAEFDNNLTPSIGKLGRRKFLLSVAARRKSRLSQSLRETAAHRTSVLGTFGGSIRNLVYSSSNSNESNEQSRERTLAAKGAQSAGVSTIRGRVLERRSSPILVRSRDGEGRLATVIRLDFQTYEEQISEALQSCSNLPFTTRSGAYSLPDVRQTSLRDASDSSISYPSTRRTKQGQHLINVARRVNAWWSR